MNKLKPRKSLRTILVFVLLGFSLAPLAFVTGYSLKKYEQSLDQELSQRLSANAREVANLLSEFESALLADGRVLAQDRSLSYLLATNDMSGARDRLSQWLRGRVAHRLWLWGAEGRLEIALQRDSSGEVKRLEQMEKGEVYLSNLVPLQKSEQTLDVDIRSDGRKVEAGSVELMVFTQIKSSSGRILGYTQQVLEMDKNFLNGLKRRLGVELAFARLQQDQVSGTHADLMLYKNSFFHDRAQDSADFDLAIREEPYRFAVKEISWGDTSLLVALGVSKIQAREVLRKINETFFTVVAATVVFLILMIFVASRILLRPINQLVEAIQKLDPEKELVSVRVDSETELGLLAESFNEMAHRTFESQKALRDKIKELEKANIEIRETQAQLVHAAKMASLGQLVAGVAHELNNPIGFIYSNLGVLREYSQKLTQIITEAEKDPKQIKDLMEKQDFDYLKKDLPRLISSCEDGARRTRDIVVGLRNFSRLDEAQLKEVDLHEGLDNTLQLLASELKNRIEVIKHYGELPKVHCYASQINQVFMNILANAAQAIEGTGTITLTTEALADHKVSIKIRDSGRGMDSITLEKIFDPFFTTKTQGSGTGLGLSISYGVVQRHGGDILVQSQLGQGTEFTIILPVRLS